MACGAEDKYHCRGKVEKDFEQPVVPAEGELIRCLSLIGVFTGLCSLLLRDERYQSARKKQDTACHDSYQHHRRQEARPYGISRIRLHIDHRRQHQLQRLRFAAPAEP